VDEADQMLDLGFIVPLRRIVKLIPAKRQTLFFSATMPKAISQLADSLLTDPVQVAVAPVATTVERVEQGVMMMPTAQKPAVLERILGEAGMERVLVFTRTKHGADKVVRGLAKARIEASAIHGNKSQPQRERALAAFKSGGTRVLVATDIAARGIHVEGVTHVVNYDLPNVAESYVHRIGRTARAGAAGIALSFCNGEERAYLRDIEKLTRTTVPVLPLPAGIEFRADVSAPGPRPVRGRGKPAARPNPAAAARKPRRSRPEARAGKRQERPAGLDAATGLPRFLMRPSSR
ncbi:MAG TPA: DEAD/DEAH box helicase, partial [Propylenella sp.]